MERKSKKKVIKNKRERKKTLQKLINNKSVLVNLASEYKERDRKRERERHRQRKRENCCCSSS